MQRFNYTFWVNITLFLFFNGILFTLFVISGQYAESAVVAKRAYFSTILFAINIVAVIFLALKHTFKFSLQDFLWIVFAFFVSISHHYFGEVQKTRYEMFLLLSILYICCRIICSNYEESKRILIICLLICGIAQSLLGVAQILDISQSCNSRFSITGTFFNPGPFSAFIALTFVLAVGVVSKLDYQSNNYLKSIPFWLASVCAFSCIVIVPATMSRSAWVSIIAVLVIIFLKETRYYCLLKDYLKQNRLKSVIGIFVTLIVITVLFVGMYLLKKDSADGRILIWKNTISLIKDNPVSGVGFGLLGGAYGDKQAEFFSTKEYSQNDVKVAGVPQYSFNDYLQIAAELGIPAMIVFLLFVFFVIRNLSKTKSELLYPFIALLIFSLTSYPLNVLPLSIVFVLIAAASSDSSHIIIANKNANRTVFGTLLIIGIIISGHQLLNKKEKYGAYREWRDIKMLYNMQNFEEVSDDYASLYVRLKDQEKFLFEYGRTLNQTGNFNKSNEILYQGTKISSDPMFYNVIGNNYKSTGLTQEAERAYKRAFYAVPNRLYPLYLLSKLYYDTNQTAKFKEYANKVLNFDPKVSSTAIIEMKQEIRQLLSTSEKNK